MKFEIGDAVILKGFTNDPMVVEDWHYVNVPYIEKSIKYQCIWFDKNGILCRDTFPEKIIVKVE